MRKAELIDHVPGSIHPEVPFDDKVNLFLIWMNRCFDSMVLKGKGHYVPWFYGMFYGDRIFGKYAFLLLVINSVHLSSCAQKWSHGCGSSVQKPINHHVSNPLSMKNPLLFLFAIALVRMVACNQAPVEPAVDMDALTAEIQAMEDAYMTAEMAKDADAIVAYYADDVTSYGSNRAPSVGKDAIRTSLAERMAKDTSGNTPSFKVLELYVGNDHITEIGSWTNTAPDGSVADNGTYFPFSRKMLMASGPVFGIWL